MKPASTTCARLVRAFFLALVIGNGHGILHLQNKL